MKEKPLVTIITVCFNSEETIERTISSVLEQTYKNIEYIIIDGKSSDSTVDIIRSYEDSFKGRMRWLSEKDKGIYHAMNKGIKMAKGDIIGIINSDDYYVENAVESVIRIFCQKDDVNAVCANMICFIQNEIIKLERVLKSNPDKIEEEVSILHPTCFIRKECYLDYGLYDTNFELGADYEFILRLINNGIDFKHLDKEICYFNSQGTSSNNIKGVFEERKIRKKYNLRNNIVDLISKSSAVYFSRFQNFALKLLLADKVYYKLKKMIWNIKYKE